MVNDNPIRGIQCRLRDALNIINNIKLSDVSSIEEMEELARYYKTFDWHISTLLNNEPFKSYIREHLDEFKAPSTPGPTKESKDTPVILNRRLLI